MSIKVSVVGAKNTLYPKGLGIHPENRIASFYLIPIKTFNTSTVARDCKEYQSFINLLIKIIFVYFLGFLMLRKLIIFVF